MIAAVESYLAVRRAAGFTLSNTEYLLRSFAGFATDLKQPHVRTATAIDWASQAKSLAQRHPVLRWMADCLMVKQDVNGNVRPVKPERLKSSKRIDGMVALIMAMSRAMVDDSSPSVYETRGLRRI